MQVVYVSCMCLWDVLCDPAKKCQCTQEVNVSDFIESTIGVCRSENLHKKSFIHKYVPLLDITWPLQPQASAWLTLNWRQQPIKRVENSLDLALDLDLAFVRKLSRKYLNENYICMWWVNVQTGMWSDVATRGGWQLKCLWITNHSRSCNVHLPASAVLILRCKWRSPLEKLNAGGGLQVTYHLAR